MEKKTTKRLGAGLGLLTVGVLGLGAITTGAWFTDQEQSTAIDFETASIEIDVDGGGFADEGVRDLSTGAIDFENVLPGQSFTGRLRVINSGEAAAKYRVTATRLGEDSEALYDQVDVAIRMAKETGVPDTYSCVFTDEEKANALVAPEGRLRDLDQVLEGTAGLVEPRRHFAPADEGHWCFTFTLDEESGDEFERLSSAFRINVDATQPTNPGWSQATLPEMTLGRVMSVGNEDVAIVHFSEPVVPVGGGREYDATQFTYDATPTDDTDPTPAARVVRSTEDINGIVDQDTVRIAFPAGTILDRTLPGDTIRYSDADGAAETGDVVDLRGNQMLDGDTTGWLAGVDNDGHGSFPRELPVVRGSTVTLNWNEGVDIVGYASVVKLVAETESCAGTAIATGAKAGDDDGDRVTTITLDTNPANTVAKLCIASGFVTDAGGNQNAELTAIVTPTD